MRKIDQWESPKQDGCHLNEIISHRLPRKWSKWRLSVQPSRFNKNDKINVSVILVPICVWYAQWIAESIYHVDEIFATDCAWSGKDDETFRDTIRCPIRPLRWRHNDHAGVSNHQPHGCLLNRLFRHRSKKTSKLRVTGLCAGNSPGPVNSPHKGPVTRKRFPFDDVIMLRKESHLGRKYKYNDTYCISVLSM